MTRHHVAFAFVVVLTGINAPRAFAQQPGTPAARPTITVAAFDTDRTGWMPPPHFGNTLAELLTDRLVAAGAFRVVDSGRLAQNGGPERGRREIDRLFAGAIDAHVDYVIAGTVTRLSIEHESSSRLGLLGLPLAAGVVRKHQTAWALGLTVRVIDVRTGEVFATSTAEGDAVDQHTGGGGFTVIGVVPAFGRSSTTRTGVQDRLLDTATQDVINTIAGRIVAAAPKLVAH